MELAFYGSSVVAILATLGVISGTNPMHALLYLIVSLIAVGMIFFSRGVARGFGHNQCAYVSQGR